MPPATLADRHHASDLAGGKPLGLIARLENRAAGIETLQAELAKRIRRTGTERHRAAAQLDQPFPHQALATPAPGRPSSPSNSRPPTATPHPPRPGPLAGHRAAHLPTTRPVAKLDPARAGIADLQTEWNTTIELACYLRNRHRGAGRSDATAAVLVDLQATMRASAPVPHSMPPALPLAELQQAVKRAERDYDRLIARHLACAAEALDRDPDS